MSWPELANKVVWSGKLYTVNAFLGNCVVGIEPMDKGEERQSVGISVLENPADCWCSECDSYAPEAERMDHPKDPENAWLHTVCAARAQAGRDVKEHQEHQARTVEKKVKKRAHVLHPSCRGRPWCAGDSVLMPMRVTGWDDDKLTLEPAGGPDDFGMRRSVVVYARHAYPDHLAGLTDEALTDLFDAVTAERLSRLRGSE